MNQLKSGLAWLAGQMEAFESDTVTYTRGSVSVQVPATYGDKLLKLGQKFDGRVVFVEGEFLISCATIEAAFAAAGATYTAPQRGDVITAPAPDGVTAKYEVGAPPGEPHFQLRGVYPRFRIHSKRIA
jgi:hypothetical protein